MTRAGIIAAMLLLGSGLTPASAAPDSCRQALLRYCVSSYAGWDVPPTLAACVDAMTPPAGRTPAWVDLRGEIARGTIPPLARWRRCLAAPSGDQSPPHAVNGS